MSSEQWEERITNWWAEHKSILRLVMHTQALIGSWNFKIPVVEILVCILQDPFMFSDTL